MQSRADIRLSKAFSELDPNFKSFLFAHPESVLGIYALSPEVINQLFLLKTFEQTFLPIITTQLGPLDKDAYIKSVKDSDKIIERIESSTEKLEKLKQHGELINNETYVNEWANQFVEFTDKTVLKKYLSLALNIFGVIANMRFAVLASQLYEAIAIDNKETYEEILFKLKNECVKNNNKSIFIDFIQFLEQFLSNQDFKYKSSRNQIIADKILFFQMVCQNQDKEFYSSGFNQFFEQFLRSNEKAIKNRSHLTNKYKKRVSVKQKELLVSNIMLSIMSSKRRAEQINPKHDHSILYQAVYFPKVFSDKNFKGDYDSKADKIRISRAYTLACQRLGMDDSNLNTE